MNRVPPSTCHALLNVGPGQAECREVPIPENSADGGLGRVLAAGVCGSDLALFGGNGIASGQRPHILGHETVVRIEVTSAVLAERWGVREGDQVFVEEFIPCGWCETCRTGRYHVCPRTDFRSERFLRYGRTSLETAPGLWGGFAEYLFLHPDARLHPVPDGVAPHLAVLATPLANGLRWMRTVGDTRPGDAVVILGPGAHGLGCVVAAREAGAGEVILVGQSVDTTRLTVGRALGASTVLRADRDDVEAEVHRRTGGRGANVVVDVTGSANSPGLAIRLARGGGLVVLAGGPSGPADGFPVELITQRELRIAGVRGHQGQDIAGALRLIGSGRYDLDAMTTQTPLSEGAELLRELVAGGAARDAPHHVLVPGLRPESMAATASEPAAREVPT